MMTLSLSQDVSGRMCWHCVVSLTYNAACVLYVQNTHTTTYTHTEQRSSEATLCNTGKCQKHLRFIICDFVLPFDLLQIQETLTVTKFIQTPTFIYWTPYGVISHSLRS